MYLYWVREKDSVFMLYWRKRECIYSEFAKTIANLYWSREAYSKFIVNLRKRYCIYIEFVKKIVNLKWNHEVDSAYIMNWRNSVFILNSRNSVFKEITKKIVYSWLIYDEVTGSILDSQNRSSIHSRFAKKVKLSYWIIKKDSTFKVISRIR